MRAVSEVGFDLQDAAVERIVTDPALWPEVEAFARAVGQRFGAYGSVGSKLEARLPPGYGRVSPDMEELFNGAGFLAARLEQRDEYGENLICRRDLYRGRDSGLTL